VSPCLALLLSRVAQGEGEQPQRRLLVHRHVGELIDRILDVTDSPLFKRRGDNPEVEVPVTILEVIRGATIEVPTLAGVEAHTHSAR
jgi:DnaJ-class molecular chaperone